MRKAGTSETGGQDHLRWTLEGRHKSLMPRKPHGGLPKEISHLPASLCFQPKKRFSRLLPLISTGCRGHSPFHAGLETHGQDSGAESSRMRRGHHRGLSAPFTICLSALATHRTLKMSLCQPTSQERDMSQDCQRTIRDIVSSSRGPYKHSSM